MLARLERARRIFAVVLVGRQDQHRVDIRLVDQLGRIQIALRDAVFFLNILHQRRRDVRHRRHLILVAHILQNRQVHALRYLTEADYTNFNHLYFLHFVFFIGYFDG